MRKDVTVDDSADRSKMESGTASSRYTSEIGRTYPMNFKHCAAIKFWWLGESTLPPQEKAFTSNHLLTQHLPKLKR